MALDKEDKEFIREAISEGIQKEVPPMIKAAKEEILEVMKTEVGDLRKEMHTEIGDLRKEMHTEIGDLTEVNKLALNKLEDHGERITALEHRPV